MKKIVLYIMIICILCLDISVYAKESPILIVESVEAEKGDTITVNINIQNNPGFAAMVLELSYDNSILVPVTVEGCDVLNNIDVVSNIQQGGDLKQYDPISLTVINATDIKGDGKVFAITFNVIDDFENDVEINLAYKKSDISNQNYEDVNCEIIQGCIKLKPELKISDSGSDTFIKDETNINEYPTDEKKAQNPIINTTDDIWVLINNERVLFDQQPIILQDRTLVPMRAIFEQLGATVVWDDSTKTAIAEKEGVVIKIQIDNNVMKKDNDLIVLDVPAQLLNSRTLVPIRAISEAFGCKVNWLGETRTVTIETSE